MTCWPTQKGGKKRLRRVNVAENGSIVEGRYLYCLVNGNTEMNFGQMGIEGSLVYTVPYDDIGAVVHRCEAKPYRTTDTEKAKEWVLAHQYIVDYTTKTFGTVIPFTFDTIFKGNDETVRGWLKEKHQPLKDLLMRLKDRDEYGVQIFLERSSIEKEMEVDEEIRELKRQVESTSTGTAYLLEKRLEQRLNNKKMAIVSGYTETFFNQIKGMVDRVKIHPKNRGVPEEWKDKEVILNLLCLVHKDMVRGLGSFLGEVNSRGRFAVRFSGPWPPYSFVERLESE